MNKSTTELMAIAAVVVGGWYVLREYRDSTRLGAPMFSEQLRLLREQDF